MLNGIVKFDAQNNCFTVLDHNIEDAKLDNILNSYHVSGHPVFSFMHGDNLHFGKPEKCPACKGIVELTVKK